MASDRVKSGFCHGKIVVSKPFRTRFRSLKDCTAQDSSDIYATPRFDMTGIKEILRQINALRGNRAPPIKPKCNLGKLLFLLDFLVAAFSGLQRAPRGLDHVPKLFYPPV
jgi:hypothetical protein